MLRFTSTILALGLVLSFDANAHSQHQKRGGRADGWQHEHVPGDERYEGWADPYAHERRWTTQLGLGAGFFEPWQGDGGPQSQIELLASSPSRRFRIGGEFIHRRFESRLFDVDDVDVDAYQLHLVMHWVANPGSFTPYLGGGLGLDLNDVSRREIERGDPTIDLREDLGLGYGVFGVLGLELPVDERLAFFAEGRVSLNVQLTGTNSGTNQTYADYDDGVDDVDGEDLGGASGVVGIRYRF